MDITSIANSLLEASREKSAPKDVLAELFPFIYTASKKMSGREISEFLEKNHGLSISQPTIARALKEPDKHSDEFAKKIFSSAETVRFFYRLSGVTEILNCGSGFASFLLEGEPAELIGSSETQEAYFRSVAEDALRDLIKNWFPLDPDFQKLVIPKIVKLEDERIARNAESEAKRRRLAEQ